jgi:hypothetical protein
MEGKIYIYIYIYIYVVGINHDFLVQFIRVQSLFPIFNQPCIF